MASWYARLSLESFDPAATVRLLDIQNRIVCDYTSQLKIMSECVGMFKGSDLAPGASGLPAENAYAHDGQR